MTNRIQEVACFAMVGIGLHVAHSPMVPATRRDEHAPEGEPVLATDLGLTKNIPAISSTQQFGLHEEHAWYPQVQNSHWRPVSSCDDEVLPFPQVPGKTSVA